MPLNEFSISFARFWAVFAARAVSVSNEPVCMSSEMMMLPAAMSASFSGKPLVLADHLAIASSQPSQRHDT